MPQDNPDIAELVERLARRDRANAALAALHEQYPEPAEADEPDRGFRSASYECDVASALLSAAAVNALPALLDTIASLWARVERLTAERDFLLARAGHAGSVRFGAKERWTGASSNAVVSIAFGGTGRDLPFDSGDLAACYRATMRLPDHLRSDAVFEQLERGEEVVGAESVAAARAAANWPGRQALTENPTDAS